MASGGRLGSGSRSLDFGSDDVLCSYDDLVRQDNANESRPRSAGKEIHERRIGRPLANVYPQQEGYNKQDIILAVEKCMKKHTDNLLTFLERITGRLSQLEDYCYNLERSMRDLRSDLTHDQKESDSKLKSLEKHLQEVHRSVQILRDKQELAETQKELAKLQTAQKDSPDRVVPSLSEQEKQEDSSDAANQQVALVLPQQVAQVPPQTQSLVQNQSYKELPVRQSTPSILSIQQSPQALNQGGAFLPQQNQLPSQPLQQQQTATVQPEPRYAPQRPETHDFSGQLPQQQPPVLSQSQTSTIPQYQHQWSQQTSQQFPTQGVQQQQGAPQAQFQPQGHVYPSYASHQPSKVPTEAYPGSAPMPTSYAMIRQSAHPEIPFGYGGQGSSTMQPQPTHGMQRQTPQPTSQALMGTPQPNSSSYMGAASFPPPPSTRGYMVYGSDGDRLGHPGSYPAVLQNQQASFHHPGTQSMRGHPYGELLEKAVGMGFAREQVASAIYRMEENGQPIDFNTLLDMLNSGPSGPRGW